MLLSRILIVASGLIGGCIFAFFGNLDQGFWFMAGYFGSRVFIDTLEYIYARP